jgi:hypothetical protein
MNEALKITNPINYPGWDDLVVSTENYSFFHSSCWAEVLNKSYRYKPIYFTLIDRHALSVMVPIFEIKSILTGKRAVSLPFSDYCQPIANGQETKFGQILNHIIRFGEKSGWEYIEFRGGDSLFQDVHPNSIYYAHTLDLNRNEDDIYKSFRNSNKRNIRKAAKEGVTVNAFDTFESIKEFFRLNCMTRKRHGLPPQPFKFFKNLHKYIISNNQGMVLLASYDSQTIGGAIFFHFGNKALYKFGASDLRFQNLRANNIIMWEAIRRYSKEGYSELCFGRTEPENSGLRQFKTGWGVKEHTIKYFKYNLKTHAFMPNSNHKAESYYKIFNYMPLPLLKLIGSLAYRHIG